METADLKWFSIQLTNCCSSTSIYANSSNRRKWEQAEASDHTDSLLFCYFEQETKWIPAEDLSRSRQRRHHEKHAGCRAYGALQLMKRLLMWNKPTEAKPGRKKWMQEECSLLFNITMSHGACVMLRFTVPGSPVSEILCCVKLLQRTLQSRLSFKCWFSAWAKIKSMWIKDESLTHYGSEATHTLLHVRSVDSQRSSLACLKTTEMNVSFVALIALRGHEKHSSAKCQTIPPQLRLVELTASNNQSERLQSCR